MIVGLLKVRQSKGGASDGRCRHSFERLIEAFALVARGGVVVVHQEFLGDESKTRCGALSSQGRHAQITAAWARPVAPAPSAPLALLERPGTPSARLDRCLPGGWRLRVGDFVVAAENLVGLVARGPAKPGCSGSCGEDE
jgi:hypothetical protein